MAPVSEDRPLQAFEAQAAVERQALARSVSELSRRLQPRHVAEVATRYAKDKVAGVVGGVSDSVKENGGTAALIGLGAVAAFDIGRRSAGVDPTLVESHRVDTRDKDAVTTAGGQRLRRKVTNYTRAKAIGGWGGGLLLGHIIGRSFDATAKEGELFGKASGEVQDLASQFIHQHSHGAKLLAAEAFGFAKYTAAFLAIMAAVGDHVGGQHNEGDPPRTKGPD
ncbi:hypothetical protein BPNPMPFG_002443 [Mesorhizobium sp. AR07]|uniref:hypothetical protein n=1 Tax=Mesorhizobium sp. AR07 TaxID=2865838 RepID=UPI00215F69A8|nr:hypothetical protein [Mesorhizobium sp. AR07]UVK46737.1 hypothetical protein BPNPMPFG_002443 [Mesorhizobium sp. AR07]